MRFAPDFGWLWGWRRVVPPRGGLSRLRAGPSAVQFIFAAGDAPGETKLTIYGGPANLGDGPVAGDGAGEWTGYTVSINGGPATVYDTVLPRQIIRSGHVEGELVSVQIQSIGWHGRLGSIAWRTTYPAITPPTEVYYLTDEDSGDRLTDEVSGAYLVSLTPPPDRAPVLSGTPAIAGGGVIGAAHSVSGFSISGFPAPVPSYSWRIDGVEVSTASVYVPIEANDGHALTCLVGASSLSGTAAAVAAAAVDVRFAAPVSAGDLAAAALTTGVAATIDFRPRITVAGDADLSGGSWSIQSGTLPAGTTHAAGVVSGSPTTVESGAVTLRYTNSGGHADVSCSFSVASSLAAPVYLGGAVAEPANVSVLHAHAAGPYISGTGLNWTIDGSPAGWIIDTSTGAVRRTPTAEGSETVTIRASNASGSASYSHTINVGPAPYVPTWSRNGGSGRVYYDGEFGADSRSWRFTIHVSELELMAATTAYLCDLNGRWTVQLFSGGQLKVVLKESASVTLVDWLSLASIKASGDWLINIQADLQVGAPTFVVSRMNMALPIAERVWETVSGTATTLVAGIVENTRSDQTPDFSIMSTRAGASYVNCALAFVAIDTGPAISRDALLTNGFLRSPTTVGTPIAVFDGVTVKTGENLGSGPDMVSAGTWTDVAARYAPDAVGPGATTLGARAMAGTPGIYLVTNTAASGAGSLKAALAAAKAAGGGYVIASPSLLPSGWIDSTSGEFEVNDATTYDLSGAKGYNASRGWRTVVKGSHVIVRGVRSAPGAISGAQAADDRDGISISPPVGGCHHVVIMNSTFAFGSDEVMATWPNDGGGDVTDLTIMLNMSIRGLVDSGHSQDATGAAGHSMALLYGRRTYRVLTYRNWLAGSKFRFPQIQGFSPMHQVVGNLICMGQTGTEVYTNDGTTVAIEANTYLIGAHSSGGTPIVIGADDASIWLAGNQGISGRNLARVFGSADIGVHALNGTQFNEGSTIAPMMTARPSWVWITPGTAAAEAAVVRAQAGAKRGPLEQLLIDADANSYSNFGPLPAANIVWPALPAASAMADSNGDGMTDEFDEAVRTRWGVTPTPLGRCGHGRWKGFPWLEIFLARERGEITDLAAAA